MIWILTGIWISAWNGEILKVMPLAEFSTKQECIAERDRLTNSTSASKQYICGVKGEQK